MTSEEAIAMAYGELRRLAASYLRRERSDHTLDATALVHEAYLRLRDRTGLEWRDENHYVTAMARAMRRFLVDYARKHKADKRGGDNDPLTLTESRILTNGRPPSFIDLDDVLKELGEMDPFKVELVELHFFAGLTFDEIADLKEMGRTKVFMEWRKARLWIFHRLKEAYGYG